MMLLLALALSVGHESAAPTPPPARGVEAASLIARSTPSPPRSVVQVAAPVASTARPCSGSCISFAGSTWAWHSTTASNVQAALDTCLHAPIPCQVVANGTPGQGVAWLYAHDRTWNAPLLSLGTGSKITLNGRSYRVVRTVDVIDSAEARLSAQVAAGPEGLVLQTCDGARRVMVTAVPA